PHAADHQSSRIARTSFVLAGVSAYSSVRWQVVMTTSRSIRGSCRAAASASWSCDVGKAARSRSSDAAVLWLIPRQSSRGPGSTASSVTNVRENPDGTGELENCGFRTPRGIRGTTDGGPNAGSPGSVLL